jgi:anti-sigma-K factor RskA
VTARADEPPVVTPTAAAETETETPAAPKRAERRQRTEEAARRHRLSSWRAVATVCLVAILATAVILVLLQSAGAIDWSFLGPVA